jgi:hypothetical protein
MKEAQRQNQLKAQERQKTLKQLQGAVQQTERDRNKNRAKTSVTVNKGVQQLLIGGGRMGHQTPPPAGRQAPAKTRPLAPPNY